MVDYLIIDYMPSPCNLPHERWSSQISGHCNLCLKSKPTSGEPWRCSSKPLSCLFEDNMAHELHKPKNIYRNTEPFPEDVPKVQGYDFNQGLDHKALLQSFFNTGFQATHFGRAVREINRMVRRLKAPADCGEISLELKENATPPHVLAHRLRNASNRGMLLKSAAVRNIHPIALAWAAAPSSWATPQTWSAVASGRVSATWPSTEWYNLPVKKAKFNTKWEECTEYICSEIFFPVCPSSLGRCPGDHGWRYRGGSDQVYGPSLFGRLSSVWQGSFWKRH